MNNIVTGETLVRFKNTKALGYVEGITANNKLMIRWVSTVTGSPLNHHLLLPEFEADLEIVERVEK